MVAAIRCALAAVLLLATGDRARAGTAVDEARALLEELRYEEAYDTLLDAWRSGGSGPGEIRTVFRLLGQLAAILGDGPGAVDHFARLVTLHPDAELPEGTSPKITRWLEAARRELGGAGALEVDHRVEDRHVVVTVRSDPRDLVAGAVARVRTGAGTRRIEITSRDGIEVPLPDARRVEVAVSVIDRYGNRLLELAGPDRPLVVDREPAPAREPALASGAERAGAGPAEPTPVYARWSVWGAAAAGAGVAAGFFALRAHQAQDDFNRLVADSGNHEAEEALAAEDRLRRNTLAANIGLGAALACGVVAGVLALAGGDEVADGDGDGARIAPGAFPGGAGISFAFGF